MAGEAKPLTAEREARLRLRATVEPDLAEVFGEIDRLRSELAGARKTTEEVALASNERMKAMNRLQGELASAREAALREAAAAAYTVPHYMAAEPDDALGRMAPGSPYDRGRYDAANAILALINTPPAGAEGGRDD